MQSGMGAYALRRSHSTTHLCPSTLTLHHIPHRPLLHFETPLLPLAHLTLRDAAHITIEILGRDFLPCCCSSFSPSFPSALEG